MKIHRDTVWKDSVTVDTIRLVEVPHFYPDDIVLRLFNENRKNVYLEKTERTQPEKITFYFSAPEDSLPLLEGLNFDIKDWAEIEPSVNNDTVTYWIKDSLIYKMDTLSLKATYFHTDTLNNLVLTSDTISLSMRKQRARTAKKEEKDKKDTIIIEHLKIRDNIVNNMEIEIGRASCRERVLRLV